MQRKPLRFRSPEEEALFHRITRLVIAGYFCVSTFLAGVIYLQSQEERAEPPPAGRPGVTASALAQEHIVQPGAVVLFPQACAQRDLELFVEIELRGENPGIAAGEIGEAARQLLDARALCREGHVDEALAMYDDIPRRLRMLTRADR